MKHYIFAFAFALALVSCANEDMINVETAPVDQTEVVSHIYEAGEVCVRFSDEMVASIEADLAAGSLQTKSSGLNQLLEPLGIKSIRRMFPHGGDYEALQRREGLHKWYYVTFDKEIPQTKAASDLSLLEGIEYAEPLRKIRQNDTGVAWNDLIGDLWGMYNTAKPGIDVNVVPVWRNYTVGDPKVIVGIFDDGVDLEHEDLKDNCASTGHYNYVDGASKITPGDHGTHVAGIVAAVSNNGKGVCGVAGGDYSKGLKGVTLMSYQIMTNDGATSDKRKAYTDAVMNGVLISQNSWGYNFDANGDGVISSTERDYAKNVKITDYDQAAIDYFIKYAGCDANGNRKPDSPMQGGLVVFAAGNDAIPYGAPANYEPVVAVGALASNGERSSFSSYGDWVDLCAPGTDIFSTTVGNNYAFMNGTSMACPYVSGVAALVLSYCGGPMFTADMLKEKLLKSAVKPSGSPSHISPALQVGALVDAMGAITYGEDLVAEPVTDMELAGRGDNIDVTWTLTADSEGKPAYSVAILYGKVKADVEAATVNSYPNTVGCHIQITEGNVGDKAACTVPGLEFSTEYFVKMVACTYTASYSDPTEIKTVSTTANNAPVITVSSSDDDNTIMPYESFTFTVNVTEPDDHSFEVEYVKGSDAEEFTKLPDGSWILTVTGSKAKEGTYRPKVKATDSFGLVAERELTYTIQSNNAPVVVKEIEDVVLYSKGGEFTIDMAEYVSDPDGESLKYAVNVSDAQVVHINVSGNTLYGTVLKYGRADVEITASDARGESVVLTFTVMVKDASVPVSVYPNPVTDYVNIATLDEAQTRIVISNVTGKVLHDETSVVSGHEPARVDMSTFAPGVYTIRVTFGGQTYKQTVVKL